MQLDWYADLFVNLCLDVLACDKILMWMVHYCHLVLLIVTSMSSHCRRAKWKSFCWRMLVTPYGLVNADTKWQVHFDSTFFNIGPAQILYSPQLFRTKLIRTLILTMLKIVGDILIGWKKHMRDCFTKRGWVLSNLVLYVTLLIIRLASWKGWGFSY